MSSIFNLNDYKTRLMKRDSSVELLRIIAMLFIVISHYSLHFNAENMLPINKYILSSSVLGNLGVDIFVVITGFFLCKSKPTLSKTIQLVFQVAFYYIGFYVLFTFINNGLNVAAFRKLFLFSNMKTAGSYWFFQAYIFLYIVSPIINFVISKISKKQHTILLFALLIALNAVQMLCNNSFPGNEYILFVLLYFCGAWIHRNKDSFWKHRRAVWSILAVLLIVFYSAKLFQHFKYIYVVSFVLNNFYTKQSLLFIGVASLLVLIFSNIKIKKNFIINLFASGAFGVYLIHENAFVKQWLWTTLNAQKFAESYFMIFHMLICAVIFYIVFAMFDVFRQLILEKPVMYVVNQAIDSIKKRIRKS